MSLSWKRFGAAWLAVALLSGWQAALRHPVEHVNQLGELVHLHSAHSDGGGSDSGPLC